MGSRLFSLGLFCFGAIACAVDFPRARIGYVVNHRYSYTIRETGLPFTPTIISAVPVSLEGRGKLVDLAKIGFGDEVPTRFIVGDGGTTRVLIEIDRRKGGKLDDEIQRIRSQILDELGAREEKEALLKLVSQNVFNQLMPVGKDSLDWDSGLVDEEDPDLKMHDLDHEPVATDQTLPVVPLENFLEKKKGSCLAQALVAWLVLQSFDIPSRIHFGANSASADWSVGHTSVELSDGRFVDPAGWAVIKPDPKPCLVFLLEKDWVYLPNFKMFADEKATVGWDTWRFRYKRYPVLSLD